MADQVDQHIIILRSRQKASQHTVLPLHDLMERGVMEARPSTYIVLA